MSLSCSSFSSTASQIPTRAVGKLISYPCLQKFQFPTWLHCCVYGLQNMISWYTYRLWIWDAELVWSVSSTCYKVLPTHLGNGGKRGCSKTLGQVSYNDAACCDGLQCSFGTFQFLWLSVIWYICKVILSFEKITLYMCTYVRIWSKEKKSLLINKGIDFEWENLFLTHNIIRSRTLEFRGYNSFLDWSGFW